MLDGISQLQQIVDKRYYADYRSETSRIAGWARPNLLRDLGPLVSRPTAQRARETSCWSANAEGIDAREKRVGQFSEPLREQVLTELMALR